jgi:hypothetical protein
VFGGAGEANSRENVTAINLSRNSVCILELPDVNRAALKGAPDTHSLTSLDLPIGTSGRSKRGPAEDGDSDGILRFSS